MSKPDLFPLFDDEDLTVPPEDDLVWVLPNLSLEEVTDLAAGIVPRGLQAMARQTLDFADFCRRNAEKPETGPPR